jgi:hypothetical protein
MFTFPKIMMKMLFLGLVLLTGGASLASPPPLPAQQMQEQAALDFLAHTGILSQIEADTPPQGRPFLEPASHSATDYAAGDSLGYSVAVSGDTLIVGAFLANVDGNTNQGAAYVFTRSGASWSQQQKLVAADGTAGDRFGSSVALDGEMALVGANRANVSGNTNQGATYVFTRSGANWSQQQKLVATDGAADDQFGVSVALDGETALVGAWAANIGGNINQGAAYVFTRSGANWSQQQKLVAADGAASDLFGISVALDGETALVGAYMANVGGNSSQGTAYVFTRSGANWSQQQKLVAADGAAGDQFGVSVALDGQTALVGAHLANMGGNTEQGAAYVFTQSGTDWSQQQKLVAADGAAGDLFGISVALDGETVLVGAILANVGGNINQGAAYVFRRSGTDWSQQQKLVATDGAAGDRFGYSVALDGDTALIGAYEANVGGSTAAGKFYTTTRGPVPWPVTGSNVAADGAAFNNFGFSVALDGETALVSAHRARVGTNNNQGAAYVFTRNGPIWVQQQKLVATDGAALDQFGISVALDGDTALIGADQANVGDNTNQGAAYVFRRSGTSWSQEQKLLATDSAAFDGFGRSVALDGETALVGAYQADVGGNSNQGAAYVFTRSGTSWSQQWKLVAADGAAGDWFGRAVALDGETALVGAHLATVGGNTWQGAAYVFTRSGTNWSQQQKLVAADGAGSDFFGISVALDGNTALVGAYRANVGDNSNQGAAYVFTRSGASWSQQQKLVAADGAADDEFGHSVALDGETALVGANLANVGGNSSQGAAHVFRRSGANWNQEQKLLATDGAAGDQLGISVALDGETALVGADRATVGGNSNQGKVYFFERQGLVQLYLPLVVRNE